MPPMKTKYLVERDKNHRGQSYLSGPVVVVRNVSLTRAIRYLRERSDDHQCFCIRRLLDNSTLSFNTLTGKLNNYWITPNGEEIPMELKTYQIKFRRVLTGIAEVDLEFETEQEVEEELKIDSHLEDDVLGETSWEHENTEVVSVEEL